MNFTGLTYLADSSPFNLNAISNGMLVIVGISPDNKDILESFNQNLEFFLQNKINLFFVTNSQSQNNQANLLSDKDLTLYKSCPELSAMDEFCESIIYFEKNGDSLNHLYTRVKPETKVDWIPVIETFVTNYNSPDSENDLWKSGQKIPVTGEYLCSDCGYIMELKQGDVFPPCPVCMSGDPMGPSETHEAFWKKL